ncbi:PTS lactose/cellobiose transporter subunit IIA [Pectinatus frisingensis]|uniref:PTS lactose/cellobiose transporter subunit IIA n=2 Tax=Pectinatus frisingensis TaxID=865 RepID=UPI003D806282
MRETWRRVTEIDIGVVKAVSFPLGKRRIDSIYEYKNIKNRRFKKMDEKIVEQSMQLILHAGTGRSMVIEAVNNLAENGDVAAARKEIEAAGKEIGAAHDIQTALISAECDGKEVEKSILLIHAQDHFMTALAIRDMGQLMVKMYESLSKKTAD